MKFHRILSAITLAGVLITSTVLTGCSAIFDNRYSRYWVVKTAQELLQERYDEDFEVTAVGDRWNTEHVKVLAHSESHPEFKFEAYISKDGELVSDRYSVCLVANSANLEIQSLLAQKGITATVRTSTGASASTDKALTLADLHSLTPRTTSVTERDICKTISSILTYPSANLTLTNLTAVRDQLAIEYNLEVYMTVFAAPEEYYDILQKRIDYSFTPERVFSIDDMVGYHSEYPLEDTAASETFAVTRQLYLEHTLEGQTSEYIFNYGSSRSKIYAPTEQEWADCLAGVLLTDFTRDNPDSSTTSTTSSTQDYQSLPTDTPSYSGDFISRPSGHVEKDENGLWHWVLDN